jgi:hypothetical protein
MLIVSAPKRAGRPANCAANGPSDFLPNPLNLSELPVSALAHLLRRNLQARRHTPGTRPVERVVEEVELRYCLCRRKHSGRPEWPRVTW